MSRHSVRRHLRVEVDAYDEAIRRFIPGYEAMLEAAAAEIARVAPEHVLDLGGGTGALAEAILLAAPGATVELIDVDPDMLAVARERLGGYGSRTRFREASFDDPLPEADAVAASLALHHVPTMDEKRRLFVRIHDCLRPGGVFVNADATMPAEPDAQEPVWRGWAAHLVSRGIPEERAYRRFAEWREEDTYFPREVEAAAMRTAGFEVGAAWSDGPMVVAVGRRAPG
ncbi:MAG: class I SAM-dependent methyltransferase [Acidobacteriota bacterium]|nr:class I SAM-dependent methyltransferase [Acidobacteriota bacterium]